MKKADYDSLYTLNEDSEVRYSQFLERNCIALIAANWVLSSNGNVRSIAWIMSLGFCVMFLFLRALGHIVNLRHYAQILDAERGRPGTYPDDTPRRTYWGYLSKLFNIADQICIAIAFISFIWAAIPYLSAG